MINSIRNIEPFLESIHDKSFVTGLTHVFYRYPARFSPNFAREAIDFFTRPGEIVFDPFMGGGTTLVEAMRLKRKGIGTDINSLAVFISKLKTTFFSVEDIADIRKWVDQAQYNLILNKHPNRPLGWIAHGYQRNISGRTTWPIRKTLEIALSNLDSFKNDRPRDFIRCLLLKTTQWAIDCRKCHPTANEFRKQLKIHSEEMIDGVLELRQEIEPITPGNGAMLPFCLHIAAKDIASNSIYPFSNAPRLILTSPPYPGVHVLYHRWQVHGRKETPAPYWIADCSDGHGSSFYTFGDRKQKRLYKYFENMRKSYRALSSIADENTWLVQLVAFSDPVWQLPLFLKILQECGFEEKLLTNVPSVVNGRIWRSVPNRKFYADNKGKTPSSEEVLLIHKKSSR